MTGIAVRDFLPTDAEACAGIFDRAWNAGHPYAPRAIDRAAFETETKDERLLVAEFLGKRAGFVSLYEPQIFVHHLYVDPTLQGRGIGRALLQRAVALVGGHASLKCQIRNADALAFYRRLGWRYGETGQGDFGPWIRMLFP